MAQKHGAFVLNSLDEVALYLNELKKQFVVTLSNNNKTVTSTNIQPITYTTTKTNEVYTYD
jgi:hypothetical protein